MASSTASEVKENDDVVMQCVFQLSENRPGDGKMSDDDRATIIDNKLQAIVETMNRERSTPVNIDQSKLKAEIDRGREHWLYLTEGLDTDTKLKSVVDFYVDVLASSPDIADRVSITTILQKLSSDIAETTIDFSNDVFIRRYYERLDKEVSDQGSFIMPIITYTHALYALWEPGPSEGLVMLSLFNGGEGCEHIHPEIMSKTQCSGHECIFRECCIYALPVAYAKLFIREVAYTKGLKSFYSGLANYLAAFKDERVKSVDAYQGRIPPFIEQKVCIREQFVGNCAFHNLRSTLRHFTRNYELLDGTVPINDVNLELCLFTYLNTYLKTNASRLYDTYGGLILAQADNIMHGFFMQFLPFTIGKLKSIKTGFDPMTAALFKNLNPKQREILQKVAESKATTDMKDVNLPYISDVGKPSATDKF